MNTAPKQPLKSAKDAQRALHTHADPQKAAFLKRFFKTGKGEYAEGDVFLGCTVPQTRTVAKVFEGLSLGELSQLLKSRFHEERLLALLILVAQCKKADSKQRAAIYRFYLRHIKSVNNWDLVDCSAEHLVGAYLLDRSHKPLHTFASSKNLWARRVAIMATFHFIKRGEYTTTLDLAATLLHDPHDLIHKAVGWMLREVGKRDMAVEEQFLRRHAHEMPRTMLRYAIERLPAPKRKFYMNARQKQGSSLS